MIKSLTKKFNEDDNENDNLTKCINQAKPINHGIAILTAPKVH